MFSVIQDHAALKVAKVLSRTVHGCNMHGWDKLAREAYDLAGPSRGGELLDPSPDVTKLLEKIQLDLQFRDHPKVALHFDALAQAKGLSTITGSASKRMFDSTRISAVVRALIQRIRIEPGLQELYQACRMANQNSLSDVEQGRAELYLREDFPVAMTNTELQGLVELEAVGTLVCSMTTQAQIENGWTASFQRLMRKGIIAKLSGIVLGGRAVMVVDIRAVTNQPERKLPRVPRLYAEMTEHIGKRAFLKAKCAAVRRCSKPPTDDEVCAELLHPCFANQEHLSDPEKKAFTRKLRDRFVAWYVALEANKLSDAQAAGQSTPPQQVHAAEPGPEREPEAVDELTGLPLKRRKVEKRAIAEQTEAELRVNAVLAFSKAHAAWMAVGNNFWSEPEIATQLSPGDALNSMTVSAASASYIIVLPIFLRCCNCYSHMH